MIASIASLLPSLGVIISNVLDRVIPDEAEREKAKTAAMTELLSVDQKFLEEAAKNIRSEAQGESWLQRNWRPILMLWFAALVGAHWLGITPANLPIEVVNNLLQIVQIGVGGYIVGRSAEKVARIVKQGEPGNRTNIIGR